jgi:hypothetical protein
MSRPELPPFVDPRHESAYWEARARVLWGQSRDDVRRWIAGQAIPPAEIEVILDACFRERASVMRRKGVRDLVLGAALVLVPIADLLGWPGFFAGLLSYLDYLAIVYGLFHLSRGVGRVVRGARAEGTVGDSAESEIGP